MSVTAIVPMRHSSERVRGKNYRELNGKPLFFWIVQTLVQTPEIDSVVIDTDSDFIAVEARKYFPEVTVHLRDDAVRGGDVPMNDVLLSVLKNIDDEVIVQTHSTNPFLRSETVSEAVQAFLANRIEFDSLFTVNRVHARFWGANSRPINHDPRILMRTQDLEPVFLENSNLYIFEPDTLKTLHNRIGSRPQMFEMSEIESWDIDTEDNWNLAQAMAPALLGELDG